LIGGSSGGGVLIKPASDENETVLDQPIAQASGDLALEPVQKRVEKLKYFAAVLVKQMVMMAARDIVAACTSTKSLALDHAGCLEFAKRPVDRGHRYSRQAFPHYTQQIERIWMLTRDGERLGDSSSLRGQAYTVQNAELLDRGGGFR